MKIEECTKGLVVGIQPSPYSMYEATVVDVADRVTKAGTVQRGVRIKPRGKPMEVVPLAMVRSHAAYKRYLEQLADDRELTAELKAQQKALGLSLREDGISVKVLGPRPKIEVLAQGEAAALLIKIVREWFGKKRGCA